MAEATAVRQQLIGGGNDQTRSLLPIRSDEDEAGCSEGGREQGAGGMVQQGEAAGVDRFTDGVAAGLLAAQQLLDELGAGIRLQLGGGMVQAAYDDEQGEEQELWVLLREAEEEYFGEQGVAADDNDDEYDELARDLLRDLAELAVEEAAAAAAPAVMEGEVAADLVVGPEGQGVAYEKADDSGMMQYEGAYEGVIDEAVAMMPAAYVVAATAAADAPACCEQAGAEPAVGAAAHGAMGEDGAARVVQHHVRVRRARRYVLEYEEERRHEMREMRVVAVTVIQREMRGLWARRRWSEVLMEGARVVMGEMVEEAVVGEVGKLMDDDEVQWRCCKELHEELRQIEEREQERQERQGRLQQLQQQLEEFERRGGRSEPISEVGKWFVEEGEEEVVAACGLVSCTCKCWYTVSM